MNTPQSNAFATLNVDPSSLHLIPPPVTSTPKQTKRSSVGDSTKSKRRKASAPSTYQSAAASNPFNPLPVPINSPAPSLRSLADLALYLPPEMLRTAQNLLMDNRLRPPMESGEGATAPGDMNSLMGVNNMNGTYNNSSSNNKGNSRTMDKGSDTNIRNSPLSTYPTPFGRLVYQQPNYSSEGVWPQTRKINHFG
eukprot:TRINITY_DN16481_c0_g1_i1.p1 TRINITY_DN16481_c0_g1~~TRINITY_DN16481_c0_g1_i1.p1  ORF type:complete len:211 (-),score=27.35 TRINITY_DN16481_c0_g1_i1:119-703(-)